MLGGGYLVGEPLKLLGGSEQLKKSSSARWAPQQAASAANTASIGEDIGAVIQGIVFLKSSRQPANRRHHGHIRAASSPLRCAASCFAIMASVVILNSSAIIRSARSRSLSKSTR